MSTAKWSVRLLVSSEEQRAITPTEHVMAAMRRDAVHYLSFDVEADDLDEGPAITIEVDANSWHEARVLAQHLVGTIFESAGLEPHELVVAWVAPLSDDHVSSLRFLGQAQELLAAGDYDLAIVAAQIHLETQIHALLARRATEHPSELMTAVLAARQWSLTQRRGRQVLEALLGMKLTAFPRWALFAGHVQRRNQIVHGGAGMPEELARESVELAAELWLWLRPRDSVIEGVGVVVSK